MEGDGDGRRRGGYWGFGHTPDPVRMTWVRDLHQDRLDRGNIDHGRHPVIQEALVQQSSLLVKLITLTQRSAESLAATGAGVVLGLADRLSDQEIRDAVAALIADPTKRRKMSLAGRKAIDGGGAQRIAARIASLLDQR